MRHGADASPECPRHDQAGADARTGHGSQLLQAATNRLYKTFFRFAPALAGSQETGARGVANEQLIDLQAGRVDNVVEVRRAACRALPAHATPLELDSTNGKFAAAPSQADIRAGYAMYSYQGALC